MNGNTPAKVEPIRIPAASTIPQGMPIGCVELQNVKRPLPLYAETGTPSPTWDRVFQKHEIKKATWPLLFCGPAGTGKTCAAGVLYMRWPPKPFWASCWHMLKKIGQMRQNGSAYWQLDSAAPITEDQIMHIISNASLVVLDDFGLRALSDAQYEIMISVLRARAGRPLVVTTNLMPGQINLASDARVFSRLCSGTVVQFDGADRRFEE